MRYKITEHAKRRRPHYAETPEKYLLEWMALFDQVFNFKDREPGKYKVARGGNAAVFLVSEDRVVLITLRGFKDQSNSKLLKSLKLHKLRNGDPVYRLNFMGRKVLAGNLEDNKDGTYTLELKKNMISKFELGDLSAKTVLTTLEGTVTKRGVYWLKELKRIDEEYLPVKRDKKPILFVSECLIGRKVRYDGSGFNNSNVHALRAHFKIVYGCPEMLGGLGSPRKPIERLGDRMLSKDGEDFTQEVKEGVDSTLHIALIKKQAVYALLKENSPTCGVNHIYNGAHTGTKISGKGELTKAFIKAGIKVFSEAEIDLLLKEIGAS